MPTGCRAQPVSPWETVRRVVCLTMLIGGDPFPCIMHTHPDDTLTARAAMARQDLADALYLVRRARRHTRNGEPGTVPFTDKNRRDYADALDALEQLVHSLNQNGHPSIIEVPVPVAHLEVA